jgi:pimeloyl-ACP methyl ester carboxylesterase
MPLVTPENRWLQLSDMTARYWRCGDGSPTLVLLHGIGGSLEAWHRNIPALSASHEVIALELPGCGRTSAPPVYPKDTLGMFAEFVRQELDQLGVERAVFVGSSLGGAVAIEYALRFPQQIEALILVSSAGMDTKIGWPLRFLAVPGLGEWLSRPSRIAAERSLRGIVADPSVITDDEIDAAHELAQLPGAQRAFLSMLRVYCNFFGIRRNEVRRIIKGLGGINLPVLLVWGDRDSIVPVGSLQTALRHLQQAQSAILPGTGHLPYVEQPEAFDRLLLNFVASLGAV